MILLKIYKVLLLLTVNIVFLCIGIILNASFFIKQETKIPIRAFCTMLWAKTLCSILGIHVTHTKHHTYKQPCFIASNHVSYIDIMILASMRPSIFVSKHEVGNWPLLGLLAKLAGTVFIDRASKRSAQQALIKMEKILSNNISLVVFPEGTTSDGTRLKQFKSTLFHVPAKMGIPIIPMSLKYITQSTDKWAIGCPHPVAWIDDMKLLPHVWQVLGIKQILACVTINEPVETIIKNNEGLSQSRKMLTKATYDSIQSGLIKIETACA
jgi:1-acyl-sn-glycerol-3-phosphate acyltransferase